MLKQSISEIMLCEHLGSVNLFLFFFRTQQHQEAWSRGTQVVANYNFEGSSPDDLPFKKGDVLTIVQPTKVGSVGLFCVIFYLNR